MRQLTRSNDAGAKGRLAAPAAPNSTLRHLRSAASILASTSISGVRSEATTFRTLSDIAAAVCPPPGATSRRRGGSPGGASILTLYDFAMRLLKHRGVFPRQLPAAQASAAMLAAVREVYATGEGDFAAISGTPGFVPALSRTMADFEEGWLGEEAIREAEQRARARGDPKARRWSEWRRLIRAVERKIAAAGGMSRRKIFQEAVAGFEQPGHPFRVTLYGFYDFTRPQWMLVGG